MFIYFLRIRCKFKIWYFLPLMLLLLSRIGAMHKAPDLQRKNKTPVVGNAIPALEVKLKRG